ncbi:MAG TPA: hypothetical protein VFF81_03070 [Noviherbaspirillum sp.]|nr:hypothetical protein [Noviherbaspirillum sp.]
MTKRFGAKLTALTVCVSLALGGCATPSGAPRDPNASASSECNEAGAAVAGALLGALVAGGKNRVRGAALGAGLAALACVAWNANTRQVKTAEQVQREYKTANGGQLPAESRVARYQTTMDSGNRIKPGTQLTVTSNIEVVQGQKDSRPLIEEELHLIRPDGKAITSRKKASEDKGAGGFITTYSMKMPEGIQQGEYPVKTVLFLNGQRVAQRDMTLQVVQQQDGLLVASIH